jgi:hypothetical protein
MMAARLSRCLACIRATLKIRETKYRHVPDAGLRRADDGDALAAAEGGRGALSRGAAERRLQANTETDPKAARVAAMAESSGGAYAVATGQLADCRR